MGWREVKGKNHGRFLGTGEEGKRAIKFCNFGLCPGANPYMKPSLFPFFL
jgi:hypothetical protein